MNVSIAPATRLDRRPSTEELIERALGLGPALKDRARETFENRNVPRETIADLHRLDLLKTLQPARFGGVDRDWSTHQRVGAALAEACGSTAWIQCVVGLHAWLAARLPSRAQQDIWGSNPDVLIATAIAGGRDSLLEERDDGYVLSGTWRYASGVCHADWIILGALPDNEEDQASHNFLELAVPISDVEINETWDTTGLRGTGSNEVKAEAIFVPKYRTVSRKVMRAGATEGSAGHDSFVHHVKFSPYFGTTTLGPILGCAKGALEAYRGFTQKRTGEIRGEAVAGQIPVHLRLAESAAEVRAAELVFEKIMDFLDTIGREGRGPSKDEWVKLRADTAFVGKLCGTAVDRVAKQMGAGGLGTHHPVRRFAEDMIAMTAHISQNWDLNAGPYGAWALGYETENQEINAAPETGSSLF